MFTFATDYYLFVFVASIGIIQIAASIGNLRGLLFFKSPVPARALGIALAVGAFVWFFDPEVRNLNDNEGGLDANVQAMFFALGALSAVIFSLLLSSIVNARMAEGNPSPLGGFDALKHTNYVRALTRSLRFWWKNWRRQTKPYFFG